MMQKAEKNIALLFFVLVGTLLVTPSCTKDHLNECFNGRGKTTTEKRGLYPFGNVSVENNIKLTLTQGDQFDIIIKTGKNVLPSISTLIKNNTLFISNESACLMFTDPWDIVEAELILPDIDTLFIHSSGDVSTSGTFVSDSIFVKIEESPADITFSFDVGYLEVNYLSGTAKVTIGGTGGTGRFFVAAYGLIDTRNFKPQYTIINSNGTNDCFVGSGSRLLDAVITNIGNVYYTGDPIHLNSVVTGSGRLIKSD